MLGTGTQTDPYIVDTWEDFVAAVGISGAYVAFPEGGGVIDMSSYGFFEDTTSSTIMFPLLCASLVGNGWRIRGLSWRTAHFFGRSSAGNDTVIENLHFTDFYGFEAGEFLAFTGNVTTFRNCTFSGVLDNTHFCYAYSNDLKFDGCSLTIEIKNGATINSQTYRANYFNNCNIKLTGDLISTNVIKSDNFDFSYLSGSLVFAPSGGNATLFSDNSSTSSMHYSIIDIEIIYKSGTQVMINNKGAKLVNMDKIKGFTAKTMLNDETFAVTEEQLHDAAYLNSIGFAIGVS